MFTSCDAAVTAATVHSGLAKTRPAGAGHAKPRGVTRNVKPKHAEVAVTFSQTLNPDETT